MNHAEVTKLVSALKFPIRGRHRNLKNRDGSEGRLFQLRKIVTAVFKYERLETTYVKAEEARGYADRLISDAIRNGDKHKETFEMANFWILDKSVLHKLFKVLAPRFENYQTSYTRLVRAPCPYPAQTGEILRSYMPRGILELRGNPYPPIFPADQMQKNKSYIHNVLLSAARQEREYFKRKSNQNSEVD